MRRLTQRSGRVPTVEVARKAATGRSKRGDARLERQAEEAADLAVRGELGVARVLTPAPAAHVEVPASVAEPLPATLRTDAELAFGADLAEVRIHRDPPAWVAARRECARAFTAGRDIFLAENEWRPSAGDGRVLVYHELAHVLQQTGRRTSPTMIRAAERSGSGPIQVEPGRGRRR